MTGPKLSFLIPSRDRRDSLLSCLEHLKAQTYESCEIVIVDDLSQDGTAEAVAERFPDVLVVRPAEHLGSGCALSFGEPFTTGDVLVNLDDDSFLPDNDAAEQIVSTLAQRPDVDVLVFRVQAPDGSIRHSEIPLRSKRLPTENTQIGYFLGGAVAFRRESLATAGGYPSDIGYASWENDLSFRLFKSGAKILFVPGIRLVHLAIPSNANTIRREGNYVRNELTIAARYLPFPYAQVHAALWIGQSLLQGMENRRLGSTFGGVRDGLRKWVSERKNSASRLTLAQTRGLSALSGRTWY